jgi:flagellar biosynthesis protein FlhA
MRYRDEETHRLGIGRALFAKGEYRQAVDQLAKVIGESKALADQHWRTELVFLLRPHVESLDAYQLLKAWLEEQHEQAAASGRAIAELDAQAAILWLVRDRYWDLFRTPQGKPLPADEAIERVGVAPLTLVVDRQTLLQQVGRAVEIERRVHQVQRRIKHETGYLVPTPFIRDDPLVPKGAYEVLVHEVPITLGPDSERIIPGAQYCPDGGRCRELGLRGTPDAGGVWLRGRALHGANQAGLQLQEPYEVLLERVVRRRLASFVGMQEVQALVDDWVRDHPNDPLPVEVTSGGVPVRFVRVLRGLAGEQVPVARLPLVCQTFAASGEKAPVREVIEKVRLRLAPELHGGQGTYRLLGLSPAFEARLLACLTGPTDQPLLAMLAAEATAMVDAIRVRASEPRSGDRVALVVREPGLRFHVRRLVVHELPDLPIVSADELAARPNGSTPDEEIDAPVAAGRQ